MIDFIGQPEADSIRPFSRATRAGGLIFVSGHSAPHDPENGIERGETRYYMTTQPSMQAAFAAAKTQEIGIIYLVFAAGWAYFGFGDKLGIKND